MVTVQVVTVFGNWLVSDATQSKQSSRVSFSRLWEFVPLEFCYFVLFVFHIIDYKYMPPKSLYKISKSGYTLTIRCLISIHKQYSSATVNVVPILHQWTKLSLPWCSAGCQDSVSLVPPNPEGSLQENICSQETKHLLLGSALPDCICYVIWLQNFIKMMRPELTTVTHTGICSRVVGWEWLAL